MHLYYARNVAKTTEPVLPTVFRQPTKVPTRWPSPGSAIYRRCIVIDEPFLHRCRGNSFRREVVRGERNALNSRSIALDALPFRVERDLLQRVFRSELDMRCLLAALALTARVPLVF